MYDKDGSGTIELPEMIEIIGTLYEMEGVSRVKKSTFFVALNFFLTGFFTKDSAAERARKIFSELDINGDGELDIEEFVKGCMDDSDLTRLLNAGGMDCIEKK